MGAAFFSLGSPSLAIAVTENLIDNERSKIIGIVPDLPDGKDGNIRIRTKFANGTLDLTPSGRHKDKREI